MPKYKRKVYFPMNKTEFIAKVAAKAGVEKKTAAALVDAALEVATDAMKEHEPISIVGFGTLSVAHREDCLLYTSGAADMNDILSIYLLHQLILINQNKPSLHLLSLYHISAF